MTATPYPSDVRGATGSEPEGLVLGDRELPFKLPKNLPELRTYLQGALEIEHLTIPPYLTAMYTIRAGANRDAYYTIHSIVLEEMLHMTLVANLLNAVGGRPRVAHPDFVRSYPARLPYSALDVTIPLQHFSPAAMRTFLLIERPQHLDDGLLQSEQGWTSIGQFYDFIRTGLLTLVEELGEDKVFPRTHAAAGRPGGLLQLRWRGVPRHRPEVRAPRAAGGHRAGGGTPRLHLRQRRPAVRRGSPGRTLLPVQRDPHRTHLRPARHPRRAAHRPRDRRALKDAYRIDPNASVAGYAGYKDKAGHDHAVAFNDAYAELLAPPGDRLQRHAPLHDPRRARDAPPAGSRRAALPQPAS